MSHSQTLHLATSSMTPVDEDQIGRDWTIHTVSWKHECCLPTFAIQGNLCRHV